MNESSKEFYENTEDPHELFKAAQRDIMNISNTIESKRFPPEYNVETICRCASEAVEKMLKGWIINNNENIKIYGIHNLGKLYDIIVNLNSSFSELGDKLNNLNNYTPKLRYGSPFIIEKHEVKECLKNLKCIYDFPLIKKLREKFNTEKYFVKLPDNINILFGEYGHNITQLPDTKEERKEKS